MSEKTGVPRAAGGDFASQGIWQCLETFWGVTLGVGARKAADAQSSPHRPAPNVSSPEAENPGPWACSVGTH